MASTGCSNKRTTADGSKEVKSKKKGKTTGVANSKKKLVPSNGGIGKFLSHCFAVPANHKDLPAPANSIPKTRTPEPQDLEDRDVADPDPTDGNPNQAIGILNTGSNAPKSYANPSPVARIPTTLLQGNTTGATADVPLVGGVLEDNVPVVAVAANQQTQPYPNPNPSVPPFPAETKTVANPPMDATGRFPPSGGPQFLPNWFGGPYPQLYHHHPGMVHIPPTPFPFHGDSNGVSAFGSSGTGAGGSTAGRVNIGYTPTVTNGMQQPHQHQHFGYPSSLVTPGSSSGPSFYNGQGFPPSSFMWNNPGPGGMAQHQPTSVVTAGVEPENEQNSRQEATADGKPAAKPILKPPPPPTFKNLNSATVPSGLGVPTASVDACGDDAGAIRSLIFGIDTGDGSTGDVHEGARTAISAKTKRERLKMQEFEKLLKFMNNGGLSGKDDSLRQLAKFVTDPEHGELAEEVYFLKAFRALAPLKGSLVVMSINKIMVAYFKYLVNQKKPDGKRRYKPTTINETFKKLFSVFSEHGILVHKDTHLHSFTGSLDDVAKTCFKGAKEEDHTYNLPAKYEMSDEEYNQIVTYMRLSTLKTL